MPLITFLIPVRRRDDDLLRLALYFLPQVLIAGCEVVVLYEETGVSPDVLTLVLDAGARIGLVSGSSEVFHKTRLLNAGLALACGEYVIAYDSDLLPLFELSVLCDLVVNSPALVLGGYRIMSGESVVAGRHASSLLLPSPAPEDCAGALYKQLMTGERFMVCPAFRREVLVSLAGWNESYCGWGCEDQDLLERYVTHSGILPARLADLLYLHFDHPTQSGWNETEYVQRNRAFYYGSR